MTLLLTLLLKSLLLFAMSGLLLFALRRSSAAARSLVCLLTLGALLALPLFSLMLPGWRVPVAEPTPIRPSPALPVREGKESSPLAAAANSSAGAAASPIQLSPTAAPHSKSSLTGRTPAKQGGGFFLLGLLLASVRPLLGLWGIRRLSRTCLDIADPQTLALTADCARLLGLKTPPRLCVAAVPVPMTWGWRRPVIALPAASTDWPEDRLRSVLLHEMAHIKRRDWPAHRLADFACALYWFHPLVWLTARRLRSETELACDDLVLASGIPAPDYARHLLEIASALPRTSGRSHTAIAMAQTSKIESRLTMILDKTHSRRPVARRVLVFALIPAAATVVTLAVLRPDAKAQDTPAMLSSPMLDLKDNGMSLLAGVTDEKGPVGKWWNRSGIPLSKPLYKTAFDHPLIVVGATGVRSLIFAFRLPQDAQDVTTDFKAPDSVVSSSAGQWLGKIQEQEHATEATLNRATGGMRTLEVVYSDSVTKATIQVGIASGPWKVAVSAAASSGIATNFINNSSANNGFIISRAFEAKDGLLLTVSTDSTDDVRIVAVDTQGHEILPNSIDGQNVNTHEILPNSIGGQSVNNLNQITAQFNLPLSQVKEFRVETRPFQWVEFKDVALQPVK